MPAESGPGHLLDELAAEIGDLRPLPPAAAQVLRLSEEDRFSAHDLAAVISGDPALSAKLLRLANSPYYGFARRIGTVRDAVVLVGFRAVRSAALVSCVMHTVSAGSHVQAETFWRHGVWVGLIAQELARDEGLSGELAFTAGVLHRVGLLALDQHRPALLGGVVAEARESGSSMIEAERRVLGFDEAQLGAAVAERWRLPEELVTAIAGHAAAISSAPDRSTLAACVLRAKVIARAEGIQDGVGPGFPPPANPTPAAGAPRLAMPGKVGDLLQRADAFVGATLA